MENLFFNFDDLHHLGKNSIIGKTVRIRYPELVSIGDNCIIHSNVQQPVSASAWHPRFVNIIIVL